MNWAQAYIESLQKGETVSFRPRGHSMVPLIKSGQLVTVEPAPPLISKGDIVLCNVKGRVYLHRVTAIQGDRYQISNNHGHINGWTRTIYGRLIHVKD